MRERMIYLLSYDYVNAGILTTLIYIGFHELVKRYTTNMFHFF